VRTETRTFRNNPRVSKVVVTTRDGVRTVKVYSPNGEEREMKSNTERALDATGDAIADSGRLGEGQVRRCRRKDSPMSRKTLPTRPKKELRLSRTRPSILTQDVVNKTVDTSKTVANRDRRYDQDSRGQDQIGHEGGS
jgi:hypothetical protein